VEGAVAVGLQSAEEIEVLVPGQRRAVAREGENSGGSRECTAMVVGGRQGGDPIGRGRRARGLGGRELVGRGEWEGGVVVEGGHGGSGVCGKRAEQMWLGSERTRGQRDCAAQPATSACRRDETRRTCGNGRASVMLYGPRAMRTLRLSFYDTVRL
jgi:hypothetical protein